MRKISYPLIVSDFDGTLVKADGTISAFSKQTIKQFISDGGVFAVSTGRMPASILPRVKELGLNGFVCCGQGSVIVDIQTDEVISVSNISNETAIAVCKKMEEMGLHIHVYDLWEYYSNADDDALKRYEAVVKTRAKLVLDKPISRFLEETGLQPCKILAMVDPDENERVRIELLNENFKGCDVTRSSIYLVEVGCANRSKGTALQFLAEKYNVPLEKTIAVGDQINDISMIQTAGLGVAVKNADESLKARATILEYTNEEDAVANLILKYAYETEKR